MIPTWTVQDRMKKARESADIEQSDMGDRLGVTRNTVSRWETGLSPVKAQTLKAWAAETHVPFAWLQWGMAEAPTPTPNGAELGAPAIRKLPRMDSNHQPADYESLNPRPADGVVVNFASKRKRATQVQHIDRHGRAAA